MVMTSPGSREALLQPWFVTAEGLPSSPAQCVTFPLLSFTSNSTMVCGLAQVNFVTVAFFKTTSLLSSYAAAPWWAEAGQQLTRKQRVMRPVMYLQFMRRAPLMTIG